MKLWNKLKALFAKRRLEREMAEEMQAHIDGLTERNIAAGMSPEEARYAALRAFGGVEQIKERARDVRGWRWVENVVQDVRYGWRQMRKAPGFTAVAVLTLALGIGATTAIFSIVNGVILQPLAFPHADRLVYVQETHAPGNRLSAVSWASYYRWVDKAESFSSMAGFARSMGGVAVGTGDVERVSALRVTTNFLETLRLRPLFGRDFSSVEAEPGKESVLILSHAFWVREFGGRQDVINQTVKFDDRVFTIIGVLPPNPQFDHTGLWGTDILIRSVYTAAQRELRQRSHVEVVARLKPGVSQATAATELRVLAAAMAAEYPATNKGRSASVSTLKQKMLSSHFYGMSDVEPLLYIVLGAAGFLLLLACVNLANLLLARASARQEEMGMRIALGASRGRIVRQLLSESLLLAVSGGAGGVLLGYWGLGLMMPLLGRLPRAAEVTLDGRSLLFCGMVTLIVGVGFGLAPAWQASKAACRGIAPRGSADDAPQPRRLRHSLIVVEVALAFVLLFGAGLLAHSLIRLQQVKLGYQSDGIYVARLELPRNRYGSPRSQAQFVQQCSERLASVPPVKSVALTSGLPIFGSFGSRMTIAGRVDDPGKPKPRMTYAAVTPGYFRTLSIPLLKGRGFTSSDDEASSKVAIISESIAKEYFPGQNPLGQRISLSNGPEAWREVVGVVGDVKQWGPAYSFSQHACNVYEPYAQSPTRFNLMVVVRADHDAEELPAILRAALQASDPKLTPPKMLRLADGVAASIGAQRFSLYVFAAFASVALVLAAIGIYGVISFTISRRTREIGVRMTLGAQEKDIISLILRQSGLLVGVGVGIGLMGALAGARLLHSLLFGVGEYDPTSIVSVTVILAVAAMAACWLPARRATKVDPMEALRCE